MRLGWRERREKKGEEMQPKEEKEIPLHAKNSENEEIEPAREEELVKQTQVILDYRNEDHRAQIKEVLQTNYFEKGITDISNIFQIVDTPHADIRIRNLTPIVLRNYLANWSKYRKEKEEAERDTDEIEIEKQLKEMVVEETEPVKSKLNEIEIRLDEI